MVTGGTPLRRYGETNTDGNKKRDIEMLISCRVKLKEIIYLEQERHRIMASFLPKSIMPSDTKGTPADVFADRVAKLADIDKAIEQRYKRLNEAHEVIRQVKDYRYRQVLELYYLSFDRVKRGTFMVKRRYTWERAANALNYSERHLRRLHRDAVKELCSMKHK